MGYKNLSNADIKIENSPIIFRPEQEKAIESTIKTFKTGNKMLWNAKMRFGKTLCALEVIKRMKFEKSIIITHRPVVDEGWYEDFGKIFYDTNNYTYGSKNKGYTVEELEKTQSNFIYFASIQDLRGSDEVGGKFIKNNEVFKINWDCIIIDEAHEGTTTELGDEVIKHLTKEESKYSTKVLSLSGTPFNILQDFEERKVNDRNYLICDRKDSKDTFMNLFHNLYSINDDSKNALFPFLEFDTKQSSLEIKFLEYYKALDYIKLKENLMKGKGRNPNFLTEVLKENKSLKEKFFGTQDEKDIEEEIRSLRNYYSHTGYYIDNMQLPIPTDKPKRYKLINSKWLYDVLDFVKVSAYIEIYKLCGIAVDWNSIIYNL